MSTWEDSRQRWKKYVRGWYEGEAGGDYKSGGDNDGGFAARGKRRENEEKREVMV